MTREEFFAGYAERSGSTVEKLTELGLHAEPCDCGDPICRGWQMMSKDGDVMSRRAQGDP